LDLEEVYLEMELAIPCGLIINELVSNSLKHAFSKNRKGTIAVTMRLGKGKTNEEPVSIILSVSDNGKGLPPSIDSLHSDSLGLKIVNSLVRQLNGSLK
jgi:two-component sensor histidine kinase